MGRPKNKKLPKSLSQQIKELDIKYNLDIDYDSSSCDGNCDDYCRCGKISNVRINSVDIDSLSQKLYKILKDDGVTLEAIYSIIGQASTSSLNWIDIHSVPGYYGEELGSAHITDNELIDRLVGLTELSEDEQIRQALINEYGYLLPELKHCKFVKEKVSLFDIKPANLGYYQKLSFQKIKAITDSYDFKKNVCGIIRQDGGIIDGYHRFKAAEHLDKQVVWVYRISND